MSDKVHIMKKIFSGVYKTFLFPAILFTFFMLLGMVTGNMNILSVGAFDKIFRDSVLNTLIGIAISIPLSCGIWDFSVGSIITLAGIIGSNIAIVIGLNVYVLLTIMVVISVILAFIDAVLYIKLRISPIIISLGVVLLYEALSGIVFDGSGAQLYMYPNLSVLATSPYCYIVLVIVVFAVSFLLKYTKYGYDLRAISSNPRIAVTLGINEKGVVLKTYLIAGILLGIAALINSSTVLVSPAKNLSSTSLMFASMGPVLIGLFIANYSNIPIGVFSGALGMNILSYGLSIFGAPAPLQTVILGVFIVLFMTFTVKKSNRQ